jgi:hypothetical protein
LHKSGANTRHYDTFTQFTEAISDFLRKTLPQKWPKFRDTVTDNSRIIGQLQRHLNPKIRQIQASEYGDLDRLNCPNFQGGVRVNRSHGFSCHILHDGSMDKQTKPVTLTEDQRSALQAICRRRKVDALVWKRARAFLLLDAGYDPKTICEIFDIGPTVLTQWRFAFAGVGLSFFGL